MKLKCTLKTFLGGGVLTLVLTAGSLPAQLRGGDDVCDTDTISDFTQRRTTPFGRRALPESRMLTVVFAANEGLGDFIGHIGCGDDGCIDDQAGSSSQARNHWFRFRPLCTGRLSVTEMGFGAQVSPASACAPANRWIVIHRTNSCTQANNCAASRSVARRSVTSTACLDIGSSDVNVFKVIEVGLSDCNCSGVASYLLRMECGRSC